MHLAFELTQKIVLYTFVIVFLAYRKSKSQQEMLAIC